MLALNSGHTIRHIAAPHLIRFCYCKLSLKAIRDPVRRKGRLIIRRDGRCLARTGTLVLCCDLSTMDY